MRFRFAPLLALFALATAVAFADENTASVQRALKEQGFYYGEVDGQPGTETTAAVRRYQIRHGLEVTGATNDETLASLRAAGQNTAPALTAATPTPPPAPENSRPRKKEPDVIESDRQFLDQNKRAPQSGAAVEREEPAPRGAAWLGPAAPESNLSAVFAHTPYERAPAVVQADVLRRAQSFLTHEGHYRGPLAGTYGPEMRTALRRFQDDEDLPRTGVLDLRTLDAMRLLPGSRGPYPTQRFGAQRRDPEPRRVYRGIWVR